MCEYVKKSGEKKITGWGWTEFILVNRQTHLSIVRVRQSIIKKELKGKKGDW